MGQDDGGLGEALDLARQHRIRGEEHVLVGSQRVTRVEVEHALPRRRLAPEEACAGCAERGAHGVGSDLGPGKRWEDGLAERRGTAVAAERGDILSEHCFIV